jgi:ribosomal-protein-alanine N-acetyltransferase
MINESFFTTFPRLETERLVLRAATLEDAIALQQVRTNREVMEYMDTFYHDTLQVSRDFISFNLEAYANKKVIYWMLEDKTSGKTIGDFSFFKIDSKHHRAEIGYTLEPNYWGKGYMTEVMCRLFSFGFNDFNLHSLEANINPQNEKSKGILLKLGFQKEAYFRENFFYKGEYLDSEIYSLLEKDFVPKSIT